jgi:hypothetical protein
VPWHCAQRFILCVTSARDRKDHACLVPRHRAQEAPEAEVPANSCVGGLGGRRIDYRKFGINNGASRIQKTCLESRNRPFRWEMRREAQRTSPRDNVQRAMTMAHRLSLADAGRYRRRHQPSIPSAASIRRPGQSRQSAQALRRLRHNSHMPRVASPGNPAPTTGPGIALGGSINP